MSSIAIPPREILIPPTPRIALPRFEFPRWLRGLKDERDDRVARMFSGAFRKPFQNAFADTDAAVNPLASASWVAQCKFNNDSNDSVGTNHLTEYNSPTYGTGKLNNALYLASASSQYCAIADNAALSMGAGIVFTVGVWVYFPSLPTMDIVGKWGGIGNREYLLSTYSVDHKIYFTVSNDGTAAQEVASVALITGTWYCVIAWYDGANLNISIDDGTINSVAYSSDVFNGATEFQVGHSVVGGGAGYFNGRIDNLCIAKSAAGGGGVLTAAQRTAFYNAGNGTETLT